MDREKRDRLEIIEAERTACNDFLEAVDELKSIQAWRTYSSRLSQRREMLVDRLSSYAGNPASHSLPEYVELAARLNEVELHLGLRKAVQSELKALEREEQEHV